MGNENQNKLDKEELKEIIDKLNRLRNDSESSFGIHQYGGGPDESYIKANKEGLVRFASEILSAANEKIHSDSDTNSIYQLADHDESDWLDYDGSTFIEYIEVFDHNDVRLEKTADTFRSKVQSWGCATVIIGIILIFIIGIVSIIKWFF